MNENPLAILIELIEGCSNIKSVTFKNDKSQTWKIEYHKGFPIELNTSSLINYLQNA